MVGTKGARGPPGQPGQCSCGSLSGSLLENYHSKGKPQNLKVPAVS